MITKIEDREYMTCTEARQKYEKHYVGMVITDQKLHDSENSLGYVVYIMDTYDETYEIPRHLDGGLFVVAMPGMAVGGIEMGCVCFDE
jgi:hypothetical protein